MKDGEDANVAVWMMVYLHYEVVRSMWCATSCNGYRPFQLISEK
jgi:hypothetical protein